MQIIIAGIIPAIITSLGTSGILTWWFKKRIEHKYEEQLATLTAKLNRDNEFEIASFKHKLELAAAERNIRYSKIFELTAETIVATYKKLLELKNASDAYTELLEPESRQSRLTVYKEKANEFLQFYLPNKIYIPKDTAEKIRKFHNALYAATLQFSMAIAEGKSPYREAGSHGELFERFFETSNQIPNLLESLEDDFQSILGLRIQTKSSE